MTQFSPSTELTAGSPTQVPYSNAVVSPALKNPMHDHTDSDIEYAGTTLPSGASMTPHISGRKWHSPPYCGC